MILEKIKHRAESSGTEAKVKYIVFEGEGHGWRKSEHVKQAMEEELKWYEDVFGFGHRED